ncbi:MAG: ABC transporter permease [Bacillota bacterium]|nr:ABC transporter permease [Bacillota bacterium]
MEQFVRILIDIGEQGLIFSILALGLLISYRILNTPDLTVDGSFPLGAAVSAALLTRGANPWLALGASLLAGALAGLTTGLLNVKLRITALLSGIIVMTMLYSLNLGIAGTANVGLFNSRNLFNEAPAAWIPARLGSYRIRTMIVAALIVLVVKLLLDLYLATRSGLLLRATGDNQQVTVSLGRDPGLVTILGLTLANSLVSLAGGLLAQQQGFFEISMGTGQMVNGLASVIIGTALFGRIRRLRLTTVAIFGSLIFKALLTIAINLGLSANYMRLMQGLLFLIILVSSNLSDKEARHATASSR